MELLDRPLDRSFEREIQKEFIYSMDALICWIPADSKRSGPKTDYFLFLAQRKNLSSHIVSHGNSNTDHVAVETTVSANKKKTENVA